MAVDPKNTFAQRNPESGLIEIIDMFSGNVVAVEEIPGLREVRKEYNFIMASLICGEVARGTPLTKIGEIKNFPTYVQICHWRRTHPEFAEALEEARRDRAEAMRDQALSIADEVEEDSDAVAKARLRVDTRKWAAGADDSARYSPKAKVEANIALPMQIIVKTGIDTEPEPGQPKDVNPNTEELSHGARNKTQAHPTITSNGNSGDTPAAQLGDE